MLVVVAFDVVDLALSKKLPYALETHFFKKLPCLQGGSAKALR